MDSTAHGLRLRCELAPRTLRMPRRGAATRGASRAAQPAKLPLHDTFPPRLARQIENSWEKKLFRQDPDPTSTFAASPRTWRAILASARLQQCTFQRLRRA